MAYAVGLIATDGCLITGQRRIDFCTGDLQLAETYLECLGRDPSRVRVERTARGTFLYREQLKDADLYRWLLGIGLTPRKSLTLGPLTVPDEHLPHLVRGLLDGDGTVLNFTSKADTTRRPDGSYRYEWFRVTFVSASRPHLAWLQDRTHDVLGIRGAIGMTARPPYSPIYRLQFGRWDSMRILPWIYADRDAPCLLRKRAIWDDYAARYAVDVARAGQIPFVSR